MPKLGKPASSWAQGFMHALDQHILAQTDLQHALRQGTTSVGQLAQAAHRGKAKRVVETRERLLKYLDTIALE